MFAAVIVVHEEHRERRTVVVPALREPIHPLNKRANCHILAFDVRGAYLALLIHVTGIRTGDFVYLHPRSANFLSRFPHWVVGR